jgi:hypothetical protein
MLLTVRNIRHIASGEHSEGVDYFEIPVEKNVKAENAHCCCKRINTHSAEKRNMVSFT